MFTVTIFTIVGCGWLNTSTTNEEPAETSSNETDTDFTTFMENPYYQVYVNHSEQRMTEEKNKFVIELHVAAQDETNRLEPDDLNFHYQEAAFDEDGRTYPPIDEPSVSSLDGEEHIIKVELQYQAFLHRDTSEIEIPFAFEPVNEPQTVELSPLNESIAPTTRDHFILRSLERSGEELSFQGTGLHPLEGADIWISVNDEQFFPENQLTETSNNERSIEAELRFAMPIEEHYTLHIARPALNDVMWRSTFHLPAEEFYE